MDIQRPKRGIFLSCFGKRGYYFAAYNFARSIKHFNPDMPIAIFHDGGIERELSYAYMPGVFDYKIQIPDEILWHGGSIDPGYIKMCAYDYFPFEHTLELDVDALALQDLSIIFDELEAAGGYFYSHIIGKHQLSQGRVINDMVWAFADDIWSHFNLPEDAVLPATNSSFKYWKRGPEAEALSRKVRENYKYPIPLDRLRYTWGGTQPDELYLNVALAQMKITGETARPYLFMANDRSDIGYQELERRFPILCLFGNKNMPRVLMLEYYDGRLHEFHRAKGLPHYLKHHLIMSDKHANGSQLRKPPAQYLSESIPQMQHYEKINLFLSYFEDPDPLRNAELIKCLKLNSACEEIENIFLISEKLISSPVISAKIRMIEVSSRPTFKDVFALANDAQAERKDIISIIANADIYFTDENLRRIKELNYEESAYALSRWEIDSQGTLKHFNYEWSQDVWIFRGKIPEMSCDFFFGRPACDNRLAFEMRKHYRRVANPSFSIKSFHLHNHGAKRYSEADRIPGEVAPLPSEKADPYRKKRMLLIQKGKVGDILICMPIARHYADEFLIDWLCPTSYHSLFKYFDYARPVASEQGYYARVLDLSFGQGGAPEAWWQREKKRFSSFIEAKYELAGIPVEKRKQLEYRRDADAENYLLRNVLEEADGQEFALIHDNSDYGSAAIIETSLKRIDFKPRASYTIFDWLQVILNATEIHCIDSSLCCFVDLIPEAHDIPKYYHKTDKVPNQWDETLLENNWNRINDLQ